MTRTQTQRPTWRQQGRALQREIASLKAALEAARSGVFDAFESVAPGAVDAERGRDDEADLGYVCRIVADVVRDREEQIESLQGELAAMQVPSPVEQSETAPRSEDDS
jgi:hypothetical protein